MELPTQPSPSPSPAGGPFTNPSPAWVRDNRAATGLVLGFSLLIALMILITLIGLSYMATTKQQLNDIVEQRMTKLKLSTEMRLAARERTASLQRMALLSDPFERDAQWMNFNAQAGVFARARSLMMSMPLSADERATLKRQGEMTGVAVPLQNQVVDLIQAERLDEARPLLIERAIPAQDRVLEHLHDLQELQEGAAATALRQTDAAYHTARHWMIGLSGSVLALSIVIVAVIAYRNRMAANALRLAGGELQFRATHDGLTGLLNRHEFDRQMEELLRDAREHRSQHVICYLDLDMFKPINDAVGHVGGDALLRQLAEKLRDSVRPADLSARVGGDAFAVVFVRCALADGMRRADEMRRMVRDWRFSWGTKSFNVSVSIGVAQIGADSGTLTDVLSLADDACRQAKAHGRNQLQVGGDREDRLARREDIGWINRLRDGAAQDQFALYAQTIQAIAAPAAPLHFEILLRLREADGKLLAPGSFLPVAERYHLMPEVDRTVLRLSLAALAHHRRRGGTPLLANINLSGQTLCDPEFLNFAIDAVRVADVPPAWLCFEITETAAVANLSNALNLVAALRTEGCRFALDDFGSGVSSFGYLKNLKVDFIKIDGVFVKNITNDPIDRAMVKSINEMAHVIGTRTIAEYVETPAIVEQLRAIEVDFAQGFGISRPQPLQLVLDGAAGEPAPAGELVRQAR